MTGMTLDAHELSEDDDVIEDDAIQGHVIEGDGTDGRPAWAQSRAARSLMLLRAIPHGGTWAGVLVTLAGVALLIVAWDKTSTTLEVGRQIPWLISAGFTGVCLVVLGLTVINLTAKHADGAERRRQLSELRALIAELRDDEEAP